MSPDPTLTTPADAASESLAKSLVDPNGALDRDGQEHRHSFRQRIVRLMGRFTFWQIAWIVLAWLTLAEVITTLFEPRLGMILHGTLLVALFFLATLLHDEPKSAFLYAMVLAPLIRLMSLSLPLPTFPYIYWYAVVGLPLLLAAYFAMRISHLKPVTIGLHFHKPALQILVALTGIGLGAIEYIILRPEPLVPEFSLQAILVPALILLIFTGFLEEFIFRGIMQHTSVANFSWYGLVYVSLVFAVLHVGYRSLLDVFFVFMVAIFFALMAQLSGSIVGVTVAHGLTNIGLFLVFPFLLGTQVLNTQAAAPQPRSAYAAGITGRVTSTSLREFLSPTHTLTSGASEPLAGPGEITSPSPSPTTALRFSETPLDEIIIVASSTAVKTTAPGGFHPPTNAPSAVPGQTLTATSRQPTATQAPAATPTEVLPTPVTPEMVSIASGIFYMGCDVQVKQESCLPDEAPRHSVSLRDYQIDRTEVTNGKYAACVAAGVCDPPSSQGSLTRPDYYNNPRYVNYPAVNVSWGEADTFCRWSGKRLPSEAEWEKAARKGKRTWMYPWGNEAPDCTRLNFFAAAGFCNPDTVAVGSYPTGASLHEVMDLAGNAAEWVSDWYQGNYYYASPALNPQGPASGELKVVRGGSWNDYWQGVRLALRSKYPPNYSSPFIGFRCATTP